MTTDTPTFSSHPVQFAIDYPDRPLNRPTTAFRILVAIPILIVLGLVSGGETAWSSESTAVAAGAGGVLFLAPL